MLLLKILTEALKLFFLRTADFFAAAFSFYAPLALIPLTYISIQIVGLFYGQEVTAKIITDWGSVFGAELLLVIKAAVSNLSIASETTGSPVLGIVLFSGVCILAFNVLGSGFQTLWGVSRFGFTNWLRRSLRSVFFIFILQIYLTLVIGFEIFLSAYEVKLDLLFGSLFLFLITTMFFVILYRWLTATPPSWAGCIYGGVVGSLLLVGARSLVDFYLFTNPVLSFYGGAGLILVLLVWLYILSSLTFYGATVATVYDKMTNTN